MFRKLYVSHSESPHTKIFVGCHPHACFQVGTGPGGALSSKKGHPCPRGRAPREGHRWLEQPRAFSLCGCMLLPWGCAARGGARCHVPPQLVGAFPFILMGIGSGPEFSAVLDKWPPQASSPLFLDRGGLLNTLLTGGGPAAFWQLTGLLPVHGAGQTGAHSHLQDLHALLRSSFSPQKESGVNDVEQGSIAAHCTPQSDHQEPLYMRAGVGDLVTARNKSCLWQEPQLCSE